VSELSEKTLVSGGDRLLVVATDRLLLPIVQTEATLVQK
jgi:hypothetical protein